MPLDLDFTKFKTPHKTYDNCTVVDILSGAFPRYIQVRMPGDDGAIRTARWNGALNLANSDTVLCYEYPGNPVLHVADYGGSKAAGVDGVKVSKVYWPDISAIALQSDATGQIGVGIAAPDGTLHVHTATAGTVAPIAGADDLTVENSTDAGLTVLTPDNSNGRVVFGSPSDNDYGIMLANYNSGSPYLELYAGGVSMLKLANDTQDLVEIGDVAGTGDVDISFNSGQMSLIGVSGHASIPYRLSVGTSVLADNLIVQGQSAGNASMGFYAGDGDGTDFVSLVFYGVGTPGSITNRERMIIQYNTAGNFRFQSEADGTGTLRPIVIETEGNSNQFYVAIDGNIGLSVTSPQGIIHSYDTISGFLLWEYDGLDATVRTIVGNGAGDCLYRLHAAYVLRDSAGAVASGTTDVSNTASVNLTVGGNTVRLRVNAIGSIDVARTAGTDTIKVAFTLRWL